MISAHSPSNVIVEALEGGAKDYMTKPIDFPVAIARIRTHLSLKRAPEKIRSLTETDHLTGLHNRRCWIGELTQEFKRTRR